MPSWITHLVTASKLDQEEERNEFIFANIMSDILEGYNVKDVSKIIKDYQTHYPFIENINGIDIPLPNIYRFKKEYEDKMQNPIIKGYYCHLLTDYFWNTYTYERYFEKFGKEENLVKIKLNDGKKRIVQWDEAVRTKQKDFRNFTNYLKNNEKIVVPHNSDRIKKYSEDLKEFKFTQKDIENTMLFLQNMIHTENESKKEEYSIFTREELLTNLEDSIQFIKEKLKE